MLLIKFQEYFEKLYSCSGALMLGRLNMAGHGLSRPVSGRRVFFRYVKSFAHVFPGTKTAVNYHKELHLGCCSCRKSATIILAISKIMSVKATFLS